MKSKQKLSVLVLRDIVPFPGMVVPLFVGRPKSLEALKIATQGTNELLLVAQKQDSKEDPSESDLFKVGVLAQIVQVLHIKDKAVKVLVECKQRVKITKFFITDTLHQASFKISDMRSESKADEIQLLRQAVLEEYVKYTAVNPRINPDTIEMIAGISDDVAFGDAIAAQIYANVSLKQEILECDEVEKRLERVLKALHFEIEKINSEIKIRSRIKNQLEKSNKDFLLQEQLKAIHQELGEDDLKSELDELQKKLSSLKLSKQAQEKTTSELKKLKMMHAMSAEATVIRNYLDWIIDLPWEKYSDLNRDLTYAKKILNKRHFGLEKIKERILEYLAVNLRTNNLKSPIICMVGPPGVGKTSLVRSIAESTGREFAKIALGGVRDEAEVKGHRRTYIGAMPGKVIQAIKKAKYSNPVILLDEIDKMSSDFRGDPASAMLEILDPEQNHEFNDHYIEIDYDISQVMFIATANSYDGIPRPLLDRMEVINLSGYIEEEKIEIAKSYLIKKIFQSHGVKKNEIEIQDDVIVEIIRYYTREAGVRGLEKALAKIVRKVIKEILSKKKKASKKSAQKADKDDKIQTTVISAKNLSHYLGARKYIYGEIEQTNMVGVCNGLAYSEVGGDLLSIEAITYYGKGGDVKITGKLGEVMKESAQAALSYIRYRALDYGIRPDIFKTRDLHIHVPEGATPKDGPSAGIALCTALVSALTGVAVRRDIAMTGEITLRGRVLGIGGLKEKLLAAIRAGVHEVFIPSENVKDLQDLPATIKENLNIIPVSHLDDVLSHALADKLKPIAWSEPAII